MLKYFYVAKKGYILKPELYKELKTYAEELKPEKLTHSLAAFSRYYRLVKSADEQSTKSFFEDLEFTEIYEKQDRYFQIFLALQGLREFNIAQFCPVSYAAIDRSIRGNLKDQPACAKALIRLFETFEKYHFINNAVCDRVGNEVERLYSDYCEEYADDAKDFFSTTDKLINALKKNVAAADEFEARFTTIIYPDQTSLIMYIFDRFNRRGLGPGQAPSIYDSTPNLKRRHHNVEHFLPQKSKGSPKEKGDQTHIDNIGNLLPLYFKDNSSLGNASPAEKIDCLKEELNKGVVCLPFVQDFVTTYSEDAKKWDKHQIALRAKAMATKAYQEVWKIN